MEVVPSGGEIKNYDTVCGEWLAAGVVEVVSPGGEIKNY